MGKKATISIEDGRTSPNDGIVKIWWWREGAELNQEFKAKKPIWEILDAHQVFLLCSVGETIEVDESILLDFERICDHFDHDKDIRTDGVCDHCGSSRPLDY
jgi:hypothetical protein